jgi:putative FmdB family regulatory protein
MPIYEYRCGSCNQVSSFFTRSINSQLEPVCTHCQSQDMRRRMSSFAMGKTVQSVHEQHPALGGRSALDYFSDPRNIGRNVEESFQRHGLDMPDSVRENISAAREGSLPKDLDL